jgi:hypothetical protein
VVAAVVPQSKQSQEPKTQALMEHLAVVALAQSLRVQAQVEIPLTQTAPVTQVELVKTVAIDVAAAAEVLRPLVPLVLLVVTVALEPPMPTRTVRHQLATAAAAAAAPIVGLLERRLREAAAAA